MKAENYFEKSLPDLDPSAQVLDVSTKQDADMGGSMLSEPSTSETMVIPSSAGGAFDTESKNVSHFLYSAF